MLARARRRSASACWMRCRCARPAIALGLRQVFHDETRLTRERVDEYVAPLIRPGASAAVRSLLRSRDALGVPGADRAAYARRRWCCGAGTTAGSTCRKPTCSSPRSPARARSSSRTADTCPRRSAPRESRSCCSSSSRPTRHRQFQRRPATLRRIDGRALNQRLASQAARATGVRSAAARLHHFSYAGIPASAVPLRSPAVGFRQSGGITRGAPLTPVASLAAIRLRIASIPRAGSNPPYDRDSSMSASVRRLDRAKCRATAMKRVGW